jgi:hypothetical protein
MKINYLFTLLFVALLTSCAANKLNTSGKAPSNSYLTNYITGLVKEGKTTENPLLIIDGFDYTFDQLGSKGINLAKRDIYQVYCLEKDKEIATRVYGEKGKGGVLLITTSGAHEKGNKKKALDDVLVMVGDKKISVEEMKKINPQDIESIDVIKSKSGIKKYTRKKYDGVIIIKLKDGKAADL